MELTRSQNAAKEAYFRNIIHLFGLRMKIFWESALFLTVSLVEPHFFVYLIREWRNQ